MIRYKSNRKNFTVYVDVSIPARIKRLARARNLSAADLANWLLLHAIAEMEDGRIEPRTREVRRVVIPD